jgi:hypothetical protein
MHQDSDRSPRFARKNRLFESFRVSAVERVRPSETAVRGRLRGREVEVRYVETSGEWRLTSVEGDDTQELSRSDLRDLGPALLTYQKSVPWVDSLAGRVLMAVNEAVFPTTLADFAPRSVSDLGPVLLLTGRTPREEIDVILDSSTGELSILVTREGRKAARRPVTSQEAWDLSTALRRRIEGLCVTPTTSLLALFIAAGRRSGHH